MDVAFINSSLAAVDFFSQVPKSYGIEGDGIATSDDDGMTIPTIRLTLSETELATLQSFVNPLDHSNDYGINLYVDTAISSPKGPISYSQ